LEREKREKKKKINELLHPVLALLSNCAVNFLEFRLILTPMHLLEVGLVLEGLAPSAVSTTGGLLLGRALVGPCAPLRGSLHPRHLLKVVRLKWT